MNEDLSNVHKEQVKLRATFLNSIGIGAILIGVFTPVTRLTYDTPASTNPLVWVVGPMVVCFLIGVALHLLGERQLEELSRWTSKD